MEVSEPWKRLYEALLRWCHEMVREIQAVPRVKHEVSTWRSAGNGDFVLETPLRYYTDQSVMNRAFHLESFPAVREAFHNAIGRADAAGHTLIAEDYAIRIAGFAIHMPDKNRVQLDENAVRLALQALQEVVARPSADQCITLVHPLYSSEAVQLDDHVWLRRLEDDEFVELITLGIIIPRVQPGGLDRPPIIKVHLDEMDRFALVRHIDPAQGKQDSHEPIDAIIQNDNDRLIDIAAVIGGIALRTVGWRIRRPLPRPLVPPLTFRILEPLPRETYMTEIPFAIGANAPDLKKRWKQLTNAERDQRGHSLRLACRRLGFAVARERDEDALIDAIIAIEAIIFSGEYPARDIVGKAIQRVSWIWTNNEDLRATADTIRGAYAMRNNIIHGEAVPQNLTRNMRFQIISVASRIATQMLDRRDDIGTYDLNWDEEQARFIQSRSGA